MNTYWLFPPIQWCACLWARRVDPQHVSFEHPWSVLVELGEQAGTDDIPDEYPKQALREWGYVFVSRRPYRRSLIYAVWWYWPVLKGYEVISWHWRRILSALRPPKTNA